MLCFILPSSMSPLKKHTFRNLFSNLNEVKKKITTC
nr:MAG TPA: hypothetical protein [Caudoviricetes sp.]